MRPPPSLTWAPLLHIGLLVGLVLGTAAPAAAVEPWRSVHRLPVANGLAVTTFAGSAEGFGVLDRWSDRVYQVRSPGDGPVRDLLYDAYFGVRSAEGSAWLTSYTALSPLDGNAVIEVRRERGGLRFTERHTAPMDLELPATLHTMTVENIGADVIADVELYALNNLHVGTDWGDGAGANRRERIAGGPGSGGLVEWGEETGLVMHMIPAEATDLTPCVDVWRRLQEGGALDRSCEGSGDDQVGALGWQLGDLAPGEARTVGYVLAFSAGFDTATAPPLVGDWAAGRGAAALMDAAQADWAGHLDGMDAPDDLSAEEQAVWRAALGYLRMAQVREADDALGQIVASFPNSAPVGGFAHEWNITWPRDSAYAIRALAELGAVEAATAALTFLLQDEKNGYYADLIGVEDYALSVCRAYGDGTEWSDDDGTGPNVELDNFGLVLWAAGAVQAAGGDLSAVRPALLDGVADILVESVDPAWDLIIADSSIWERHWDGRQRRWTYTTAFAVAGLRAAAELATAAGDGRAATYAATADQLEAGLRAHLVSEDGVLVANLEDHQRGLPSLDLAAVEAINLGLIDARGPEAAASFDAWEGLRVAHGNGFMRNDDGDLYDRHEWIMVDLRLAEALRRACRLDEARALEAWVIDQAAENYDMVPELMEPSTAAYAGPVPMLGFGSGLTLLSLHRRAALEAACPGGGEGGADGADGADGTADGTTDGGGDGGATDGGAGGDGASDGGDGGGSQVDDAEGAEDGGGAAKGSGCAGAPVGPAGLGLLLGALALAPRRRRA
ncbi:MAG: hypothetical protein JNM72_09345 [Deltaproteobacteria bacterium]|nr:hypothetical protein [Deltaproteobacteria bacterium]